MANYQIITPMQLGQAAITTSYSVVYTCPTGTKAYLKEFDIINTTASTIRIYVNLVPEGGTPDTTNALFYYNELPAYTTMQWTGTQILEVAHSLRVKASAVGCTITASGAQAT